MRYEDLNEMCGGEVACVETYTFGKNYVIWDVCGYDNVYHKVKVPLQKVTREQALELLDYYDPERIANYELEMELHRYHIGIFIDHNKYSVCNSKFSEHTDDVEDWSTLPSPVTLMKRIQCEELRSEIIDLELKIEKIQASM
uniref:Uncharacterized protein n=1 Tax=Aeromonas phage vB_AdhaM_G2 TaxID=3238786 RepID=A0AB39TYU2_9CAUD